MAVGPAKRKERIRPAKPEKENKPAPEKREVVTVTVDTVSYTHLDVYKRQPLEPGAFYRVTIEESDVYDLYGALAES